MFTGEISFLVLAMCSMFSSLAKDESINFFTSGISLLGPPQARSGSNVVLKALGSA